MGWLVAQKTSESPALAPMWRLLRVLLAPLVAAMLTLTLVGPVFAYDAGDLLQVSGREQIWRISENGQRQWVADLATFNQLGLSWSALQTVDQATLDQIPLGSALYTYPPVQQSGTGRVYMYDGSQRRWVQNLETFTALGLAWDSVVTSISGVDVWAAPEGSAINLSSTPTTTGIGEVSTLVMSPFFIQDGIMWVGTTTGGVRRSSDSGSSFAASNEGLGSLAVHTLAPSPEMSTDGLVLVGTDNGVYRSTDKGITWSAVSGLPAGRVAGLAYSPKFATDRSIYALVDGAGLYRSIDLGQTWELVQTSGLPTESYQGMATADGKGPPIHFIVWTQTKVCHSSNSGAQFSDITTGVGGLPEDFVISFVALDLEFRDSRLLLIGTQSNGLYRTVDGGSSYALVLGATGGTIRSIATSPNFRNDGFAFAGTSTGGVYRSRDWGANWAVVDVNLDLIDIAGIGFSNNFNQDRKAFVVTPAGRTAETQAAGDHWWTHPTNRIATS